MKKFSARSLVSIIVILSMMVSTLCIGNFTVVAESTDSTSPIIVPLNNFVSSSGAKSASVINNDPNNDGVARKIHIDKNSSSGDYTTNLWFTASNNRLGFEFGSGKNYKFWVVAKGDTLNTCNINFISMNNTDGNNDTIETVTLSLIKDNGYNDKTWTKIDSTNYITMSENVTQVKFHVWINPGSLAKNIYIDSIGYAEYDAEAGKIIAGTEKEMDLSLLTVNSGKASVSTVSDETYVTDVDDDSDTQALKIVPTTDGYSVGTATVNVRTGRKYQLSLSVKGASLYNGNIPMTGVSDYTALSLKGTYTEWTKLTTTFVATQDSVTIRPWLKTNDDADA